MHRQIAITFVFLGFALALVACKTPGSNDSTTHEEQAPAEQHEQPQEQPTQEEAPAPIVEDEPPFDNDPSCPPPEEPEGMCIQMIAFAKHPDTGVCCQYPTPCHAPEGWETYPNLEECEGA